MKLQGVIEVVQNLRACLDLRLPDGLLLSLLMEKLRGDHGLDDCPVMGPLRCPLVVHLRAGRRKLSDLVGGTCCAAAAGSMSLESPNSSLLSGS